MKTWSKAALFLCVGFGVASQAQAAGYGMAGCGLGSLLISDNSKMQVLAATTNGTFGSQTFGITTGTSNCKPAGGGEEGGGKKKKKEKAEQEAFISNNLASLSKDMARGEGETLKAFVTLLGCEETVHGDVAGMWKDAYGTIFAQPGAVAVLDQSTETLKTRPDVAERCTNLI